MSDNVIQFPIRNKNQKTITLEEISESMEQMGLYHIQETIALVVPVLFNQLEVAGFYLGDDEDEDDIQNIRDAAFIVEAIRSMLCKHYGIYHPFNDLVDNIFEKELSPEGALKIAKKINLKFKQSEKD